MKATKILPIKLHSLKDTQVIGFVPLADQFWSNLVDKSSVFIVLAYVFAAVI